MELRRGNLITVVAPGDYGKPRPALIVQSDEVSASSVIILLMTSDLGDGSNFFRRRVVPSPRNGLRLMSDVMVDKIMTLDRSKVGSRIGSLDNVELQEITALLALILGMPTLS